MVPRQKEGYSAELCVKARTHSTKFDKTVSLPQMSRIYRKETGKYKSQKAKNVENKDLDIFKKRRTLIAELW